MKKSTVIESLVLLVSGGVAADLGYQLAQHDVPAAAIVATVMSVLSSALLLVAHFSKALGSGHFECRERGCSVRVSFKDVSSSEASKLRALVSDHSRHGAGA